MSEKHRYICNSPDKITANSSNELLASNALQKKYMLALNAAETVILHPSFLCPGLKKKGDELHLFMLVDGRFYNTFDSSEGKQDKKAGPALSGAVNRFLKIVSWKSIDKTRHTPQPLFTSNDQAKQKIEVHYLWCTNELKNDLMLDKDGNSFAQIHPKVLQLYQHKGLYWGFQIVIKKLQNDTPGLYDISWVNYKKAEPEDEPGYFYDLQDQCVTEFNKTYRNEYHPLSCDVSSNKKPVFTEQETEIQGYHPLYISDKDCLGIGHLSDVHVSSRQHLFTQSKAKLIEGDNGSNEIGDMVNTSYSTLKNLMGQMAEDKDIDLLIFTGDLIDYNRNYNPDYEKDKTKHEKKSSEIWELLNLDNLADSPSDDVAEDGESEDKKVRDKQRYPVGIDNLVIYELFRDYYNHNEKPIMLISGNHEGYTLPYGISPRVKVWSSINSTYNWLNRLTVDETIVKSIKQTQDNKKKIEEAEKAEKGPNIYDNRANEGIPADTNLTITEAILMYGPDYARVVMSASYDFGGERNFRPENMDWFYHVFTPLSSFYTTYGEQCFIGLGWGNDERFVGHIPKAQGEWKTGGFLPRSVEGVTKPQLEILEQGLKKSKKNNLLLSHFTFVNYSNTRPINETGKVVFSSSLGVHDYGTFEENRSKVYPIIKDQVQYSLSGHSHRCGLYQFGNKVKSVNPRGISRTWSVNGQAPKDGKFHPVGGGCRMLVAASGGPIPGQNYNHELFNLGLDRPSGNYIKFSGSSEAEIGIKMAANENSKPRLAVALDYADLFLRDDQKTGVFTRFESEEDEEPFIVELSEEIKLDAEEFIDQVMLMVFQDDGKRIDIPGIATDFIRKENRFKVKMTTDSFDEQLKKAAKKYSMGFLKIWIKSGGKSIETYDTDKQWVFPVELISKQKQASKEYEETMKYARAEGAYQITDKMIEEGMKSIEEKVYGYLVRRHTFYGEIPDFRFYKLIKPYEYK